MAYNGVPTDEQLRKLQENRRAERPEYFNAALGESQSIASDTEDALILLSSATKKLVVSQLKLLAAQPTTVGTTDQNALLAEFAQQQESNSAVKKTEIDVVLQSYNTFRSALMAEQEQHGTVVFSGMEEILLAITAALGARAEIADDEHYQEQIANRLELEYKQKLSSELQRELQSWTRALLSYP